MLGEAEDAIRLFLLQPDLKSPSFSVVPCVEDHNREAWVKAVSSLTECLTAGRVPVEPLPYLVFDVGGCCIFFA